MEVKGKWNHNVKLAHDAYANIDSKHEKMLKAMTYLVAALSSKRGEDESKKDYNQRIGYMLGVTGVLATFCDYDKISDLETTSGLVEQIVNIARDESALLAFAKATNDRITKSKTNPVEVRKLEVDEDGNFDMSQLDDLPADVRDRVLEEVEKINKENEK